MRLVWAENHLKISMFFSPSNHDEAAIHADRIAKLND
jgi:hypothetical protein